MKVDRTAANGGDVSGDNSDQDWNNGQEFFKQYRAEHSDPDGDQKHNNCGGINGSAFLREKSSGARGISSKF